MNPRRRRPAIVLAAIATAAVAVSLLALSDGPRPGPVGVVSPAAALAERVDGYSEPARIGGADRGSSARIAASSESAVVAGGGFYAAAPGTRFEFALESESRVQFGETADGEVGVALSGTQTTTVLDRRDAEVLVEIRYDLDATVLRVEPGASERLASALSRPTLLKVQNNGRVLGIRFAEDVSRRARDTVRGLVSGFRFVVRDAGEWRSHDQEPNGVAEFGYRWTDRDLGNVQRIRDGFESAAEFSEVGGAPKLEGAAEATIDGTVGWRTAASYDERMSQVAGGLLPVSGHGRGSLQLTDVARVQLSEPTTSQWDAEWDTLAASSEVESGGDPLAFERRFWSERLAGMTVPFLVSRLEALLGGESIDLGTMSAARTDLEWMLRLDPARLGEVEALIGAVAPEVSQTLLFAVGRVGDAACQDVLLRAAADRGRDSDVRQASLFSIADVDHPTPALLSGLERMYAPGVDDPARGTAMLVAGALAGLTEEGTPAIASLLRARPHTGDPADMIDWITALGNTRSPRILAALEEFEDHADGELREVALAALKNATAGRDTQ